MRIADMPLQSRPRERFLSLGPSALSDAELLAIVMQKGTRKENVLDMANRLLSSYPPAKLAHLSIKELQSIDGIGPAKAMQLKAALEFSKRHAWREQRGKPFRTARDVFLYTRARLPNDKEYFLVMLLDTKNRLLRDDIVSVGILNASLVHPREIFRTAIREAAHSIIIAHNHPSGDAMPSAEDHVVTKSIFAVGELINIPVLDHVIVGKKWYSFRDGGL
ncbi:DNA repair protein RadC [Candidatus Woesearchaeota archaeon]|nr:DNA repair protein RadC [Candidatus Woesearchaeota archaeon]